MLLFPERDVTVAVPFPRVPVPRISVLVLVAFAAPVWEPPLAEVVAEAITDLVEDEDPDPVPVLEEETEVPVGTERIMLEPVVVGVEVGTETAVESDVAVESVGPAPTYPGHPGTVVFGGARPPPQSRTAIAGMTEARMRRSV